MGLFKQSPVFLGAAGGGGATRRSQLLLLLLFAFCYPGDGCHKGTMKDRVCIKYPTLCHSLFINFSQITSGEI